MKYFLLFGCFLLLKAEVSAQPMFDLYRKYIAAAHAHYQSEDYRRSAINYTRAFEAVGGKGTMNDHYNAACAWALSQNADSAFYQLSLIVCSEKYDAYEHTIADNDLDFLHNDSRWEPLLKSILRNKKDNEQKLDKKLITQLDSIYKDDQQYRLKVDALHQKHGNESGEVKALWRIIHEKDSVNLLKVLALLDKNGWLGPDVVGQQGNNTVFLVIQHAGLKVQQKYLPVMRDAVKKGNAFPDQLALLEDRVAIGEGRKQLYGSQIGMDKGSKTYYIEPIEDPDNLDKRRKNVGLQTMQQYVDHWGLKWDITEHKRQTDQRQRAKKAR